MTKKAELGIELEFFKVEGECVGIGASDFADRKRFPLIHDSELNYDKNHLKTFIIPKKLRNK
ncbi:MAG: hypothetical protein AABX50_00410 [Nanoarchaeota archaeon]